MSHEEEEDSKELANAGSFGIRLDFEAKKPMAAAEISEVVGGALLKIGKELSTGGGLIGHVKAFVKAPEGFVKVNLVDLEIGYDFEDSLAGKKVAKGTMNVMAAVVGSSDEEVRDAVEMGVAAMSKSFKSIHRPEGKGAAGMISLG